MAKQLTISNTEVAFCGYTVEDGFTAEECAKINKDAGQRIARIIVDQMGGAAALAIMLGAKDFASHSDEGLGALSFKFKGSRKANYIKIILAGNDTYTLRFGKIKSHDYEVVEFIKDVYNDQLGDVFRRVTGLETIVPRIVGINA